MSDAESETDLESLLEGAIESLARLDETLAETETLDELDDDAVESVIGDLDALARVASEVGELLEAMDLDELPDAVDAEAALHAIDVGELPEALADEDEALTEAVDFAALFDAIDLLNAWNASDLTALWAEKRELDEALEDLEEDAEGTVEDTLSDVAASDERLIGSDDDALIETEMDTASATKEALGDINVLEDPEAYQAAIQQRALAGIDAFRAALLETHERFERLYEYNREKMRRQDTGTNSRNPTASSTMPTDRRDLGGGARYSTVPQDVKLSTAQSRKRIYGRRFEIERERLRRDERQESQRQTERRETQRQNEQRESQQGNERQETQR